MRPCPRCGGLVVHVEGCESETIHGLRAEVERLKAALATARDSLQHQSEAAAQGWERAATYIDALNAEKMAHLATRTELDKAVAWLDRCQWARSVIDLDSGPLEVQLATALGRVKRLTAALRGLTTWLSSWRHAVSIRAIGAEQAWASCCGALPVPPMPARGGREGRHGVRLSRASPIRARGRGRLQPRRHRSAD